jgi:alkylation response protein AidB-like acyl-CoA dehydrogenase
MQLAQQLDDRAAEAVGPATLPADLVAELESAGMFQMGLPRGLGGSEVDPMTLVRTAEVLAHADGSTAWTVMTGNGSMFFAWLDHSVAAELLDGRASQPVASSFAPSGQAVETAGGYRVSGRWSYVSGAPHATNIIVAFVIAGECPVVRWGVLPATALEVLPTWNDAAGMRGSGSHDVVADGVFVPAEHTLMPLCEPAMADGALYRLPFFTGVRSLLTGVPLGIARRALDELTEFCRHKTREMAPLVEDHDVQIRLAEAESALRAARSYAVELTQRTWTTVKQGQEVSVALRTEYTLAAQFAMRSAVGATNLAFEIAGVSSALAGSAIQRCWRDANVASQHIAYSRTRWRGAGQALLGLNVDPLYL